MSSGRDRFYKQVSVGERDDGYAILLDGRPVKTPAGNPLTVPSRAVAEALAEEWRAQDDKIRPETMPLTKLANTAIDRVAGNRGLAEEQILAYAKSDLVCYRADSPMELIQRQSQVWDPLLTWLEATYGAALKPGSGIGFVEQPADALAALSRVLAGFDDFTLATLHTAAGLTGSAVIALALAEGRLSPEEAFAAAHVDEFYQAEKWGRDAEAERRRHAHAAELIEISKFLSPSARA